mgnify:CR=1 FL=1
MEGIDGDFRPVVVAVFDHMKRGLGDEKFFEVKLGAFKEMNRARKKAAEGGRSS